MPVYFTKMNGWRNSSRTSRWKGYSTLEIASWISVITKIKIPTAKVWWLTFQYANNITSQWLHITSKQRHQSCTWKGQGYTFLHSPNSDLHTAIITVLISLILYKSGVYENFRKFNQICCMKWVSLVFIWLMSAKRAEKTFMTSEEI